MPSGENDLFTMLESGYALVMDVPCCGVSRKILVDLDSEEEFLSQCEGEGSDNPEMLDGFNEGFMRLVEYLSSHKVFSGAGEAGDGQEPMELN